jgi:hypothetical protein
MGNKHETDDRMKKHTINPEQFINEAESMLQEAATKRNLTVWRGTFVGLIYPYDQVYDCIAVGIGDGKNPPTKSQITLSVRQIDQEGAMYIEDDHGSSMVPFGGGWHPLEELEKFIERLPDFSQQT